MTPASERPREERPTKRQVARARKWVREHELDIRLHMLRIAFPLPKPPRQEDSNG